jgi:glycosyltransferase involved in cell wall biosynthesis
MMDGNEKGELELTVIVPARNEEISLRDCLESLVHQSEPGFELGRQWELIVVDDHSTDGTGPIAADFAARYSGVTVLSSPLLLDGFTGKNNACWVAAQRARGKWMLFTDADTVHEAGDLSRSLREAERHGAVLLSYSPRQMVTGFWQRVVMPLVFSELASVYVMKQVNDPKSGLAAANGQFLLVEREAYFAVGGHRAVAKDVLEDVALARAFKRSDRLIRFRYAPEALSTRMYRTTREMIEGWTKNLALLFPAPVQLAAWRVLDVVLYFGLPALALGLPWLVSWQRWVVMLFWCRTLLRFYRRVARSNFPAVDVGLSILGVPLFVYLLIRSAVHHRFRKAVEWKGRSYRVE